MQRCKRATMGLDLWRIFKTCTMREVEVIQNQTLHSCLAWTGWPALQFLVSTNNPMAGACKLLYQNSPVQQATNTAITSSMHRKCYSLSSLALQACMYLHPACQHPVVDSSRLRTHFALAPADSTSSNRTRRSVIASSSSFLRD